MLGDYTEIKHTLHDFDGNFVCKFCRLKGVAKADEERILLCFASYVSDILGEVKPSDEDQFVLEAIIQSSVYYDVDRDSLFQEEDDQELISFKGSSVSLSKIERLASEINDRFFSFKL